MEKARMADHARDEILGRLKAAPQAEVPARPAVPPLHELAWSRQETVEKFVENLILLGCAVHRVADVQEALEKLTEMAKAEGLTKIAVSEDDVVTKLDLVGWGKRNGVEVLTPRDCKDREDFKRVVFEEVQAGVTGVDFAVAESGTLCLVHGERQPRLVSIAPIWHIAVVPADKIRPVYEGMMDEVFGRGGRTPHHVTLISGPSMTADIQATLFTGMHGPKKVTVILVQGVRS